MPVATMKHLVVVAALGLLAVPVAALAQTEPTAADPAPSAANREWRGFGFDRVDLISEAPGTWIHYEVPMLGVYPTAPLLRFAEQVQVVFRTPWKGFHAGISIGAQTLTYEHPLAAVPGLYLTGGVQTRLLFPTGLLAGIAYRVGIFRFGASLSAFTNGTWLGPTVFGFDVLPVIGIGIGAPQ